MYTNYLSVIESDVDPDRMRFWGNAAIAWEFLALAVAINLAMAATDVGERWVRVAPGAAIEWLVLVNVVAVPLALLFGVRSVRAGAGDRGLDLYWFVQLCAAALLYGVSLLSAITAIRHALFFTAWS